MLAPYFLGANPKPLKMRGWGFLGGGIHVNLLGSNSPMLCIVL